jgi:hypothetical protein
MITADVMWCRKCDEELAPADAYEKLDGHYCRTCAHAYELELYKPEGEADVQS